MKAIHSISLLCMAFFVFACTAKQESEPVVKTPGKNIGLQLYSLRDAINFSVIGLNPVIDSVSKMGYKYVETANYSNGKIYDRTPEKFKAQLEAAGLFAISCHVGKSLPKPGETPNWDEIWAWWDKCIDTHAAAGMKYIITPSMPTPDDLKGLQAYCDYYNQIGEKCSAKGLKFGYHNHAYEFEKVYPDGTVMYDYMVQHTDPSKVFFELDVYWCQKGGRPAAELFKQYPGRFTVLHIKDEKELGASGDMNFEELFNNIDPAVKYLIVEVEHYDLPLFESVKASLNYLNNAGFVKDDYSK